ncbi:MAG: biopolymer transporter ExbD [Pirellula sp.]
MSTLHSASQCEPNLVPILDMVFQLITFFMLVVNFKAVEVDKNLVLPVVGSADPVDQGNQGELLVLNIRSDGTLQAHGNVQPNASIFLRTESSIIASRPEIKPGDPFPVTVVLRADRKVSFEKLMQVVDACKANRFNKIDFVVVRSKELQESLTPTKE